MSIATPLRPKVDSLWWSEYLSSDGVRDGLRRRDNNRAAKDFRRMFRVPFELFEEMVVLILSKGWYNTSQKCNWTGLF